MSHDVSPLDGVFKDFVDTNIFRGRNYSFDELLSINEELFFKFEHCGTAYLASVSLVRMPDSDVIVIKLPDAYHGQGRPHAGRLGGVAGEPGPEPFPNLQRIAYRYGQAVFPRSDDYSRIHVKLLPKGSG